MATARTTIDSNGAFTISSPTQRVWSNYLINRNYAVLWGGQALSILGNTVFNTTLVIWIASQLAMGHSWAPLAVSGVLLAAAIPAFLIGPFAGVFVDRMDKRRMMLAMDGLRAIISAVLILATGIIPLPFMPNGRLPTLLDAGRDLCHRLPDQHRRSVLQSSHAGADRRSRTGGEAAESDGVEAGVSQSRQHPRASAGGSALHCLWRPWSLLINALSFVASFITIAAIRAPKAATSVTAW